MKKWFYVYDCSALALSHKLPPPRPLVEKEDPSEPELDEVDELESDLKDYHRKKGCHRSGLPGSFLSEVDPASEGM